MRERRNISFLPSILKKLQREAFKRGLSVSELLRRIVDEWFDRLPRRQ